MWSPWYTIALIVALYAYAGHLTWLRMLLTDPQGATCKINMAVRDKTLPFAVYALFVALWLPLLTLGWTASKIS